MALIEFAPIDVPLERRLQTLAVIHYVFFFLIAPPLSILIAVYLLFTSYWWITTVYIIWVIYDRRTPEYGSRPLVAYKKSRLWKYFAAYFPIELIKTVELSPQYNYIIGSHPHGIMGIGTVATLCSNGTNFDEKFPGIKTYLATLKGQFWFPFRREYIMLSGAISCNKESLRYLLENKKGIAIGIVIGGAEEALDAHPSCYNLILMKRKGFVKLAIETGAHLVPMFNFGENDLYNQVSNERGTILRSIQTKLCSYAGFSPPIFSGRGIFNYTFGILPFRKSIHTVVGRPIVVQKKKNPSSEEVERVHRLYCEELQNLFDMHKMKYGVPENEHLKFY